MPSTADAPCATDAPFEEAPLEADAPAAVAALAGLGNGDAVLVKGSRVAALERVAEKLG